MAGLLGDGFDDPRSAAIMALSGGLLRGDFGGGLMGAQQAYQGSKDAAFKQQMMQAQLAEQQAAAADRRQKMILAQQAQEAQQRFLNGDGSAPGAGAYQPGPDGVGPALPPGSAPQAGGLLGLARSLGIPEQVIQADVMFNGGKKIAEIVGSRAAPKWENINGNLVNVNTPGFSGGFQPGMAAGKDGQVTAWQPDGNGGLVVGAPRGALDTYKAFKDVDAGVAAGQDLVKVVGPDGAERYVTRAQAVQAAGGGQAPAQMPRPAMNPRPAASEAALRGEMTGGMGADPAALSRELAKARQDVMRVPDANSKAMLQQHIADLERQQAALPQRGPMQAGLSPAQKMETEVATKSAVVTAEQVAKDVAEARKGIMTAGFSAPANIAKYEQIGKLLKDVDGGALTASGTQIASVANSLGLKIDKNLSNKEAAASLANEAALILRSPAGGAGMPGAMSDQDRTFLQSMTPNQAQSAAGRKLVIDSYVAVQKRNQQTATFARNYEKKYGKLDNGFFEQMQAWSNANPLFGGK